jgi:hypothetical protein
MNLKDIGIELGYLISGLFGSILMVSKQEKQNLKQQVISIFGGMASANYLTPVIVEMANMTNMKMQNGLAFIVGFLGLKLVEVVSDKLMNKIEKPKPKKRKR